MRQDFSNVRFWARVCKTDTCWLWTGGLDKDGYGKLSVGKVSLRVHRFMFERAVGPIPNGLGVLHRCDVRNCCNPAHLFLGTATENDADRDQKGRQAQGETHGRAKLNWAKVEDMRQRHAAGLVTNSELAKEHGVCQSVIADALAGRTWRTLH